MREIDLVIVGGGSAGMASAIEAKKNGINNVLILEKDETLGGILNQCIHTGFGLQEFKEELSGPEYLSRFVSQINELKISYKLNTTVINIDLDKHVTFSNSEDGVITVKAKSIIFATGCYERGAGAINLSGDRCSGIITAGAAQKYLNIHGFLVGKRIVILGSGDIGLIMARRMTLEGAKVMCVSEIMPYSNGLNRNISQCLNDFNIPLYLSRTVSKVIGSNGRLEKVILTAVDENMKYIPNTDIEIECDTLLLSVGLIPYISLLNDINCKIGSTKGALVDNFLQTSIPGIFACGNCLHVHDVVDFVTVEGREAGKNASLYIRSLLKNDKKISVKAGENINYVIPNEIKSLDVNEIIFKFRVKKPMRDVKVNFKNGNNIIASYKKLAIIPSEMVLIKLNKEQLSNINHDELIVEVAK